MICELSKPLRNARILKGGSAQKGTPLPFSRGCPREGVQMLITGLHFSSASKKKPAPQKRTLEWFLRIQNFNIPK